VVALDRLGEDVIVATKDRGEPPGETDPRPGVPPSPTLFHLLTIPAVDLDGDGALSPDDCDDGDAALQTPSTETCNGVDDDCDGTPDSPPPPDARTWYPDADPPADRAACGCAGPASPTAAFPLALVTLARRRRR
jgi:uncharacterized protein (TIGR03382 family)